MMFAILKAFVCLTAVGFAIVVLIPGADATVNGSHGHAVSTNNNNNNNTDDGWSFWHALRPIDEGRSVSSVEYELPFWFSANFQPSFDEHGASMEQWDASNPTDQRDPLFFSAGRQQRPRLRRAATELHRCATCQMNFNRLEHLKRHERSRHSDERPFACDFCGRTFKRQDNFATHLRIHQK